MTDKLEKPTFPKGGSSWWKKPRKELNPEQLELKRKYDRELRAFHRQDPEKKQRDLDIYNKHVDSNREKVYERNKQWRKDNWDAVAKQRKDSGYNRRSQNNWYHNTAKHNKDHVLKENLRSRVRSALKENTKSKPTMDLIGCSIPFLKEHLENQFQEGMTWDNYGDWHIDHRKPCCSFDLSIEETKKSASTI